MPRWRPAARRWQGGGRGRGGGAPAYTPAAGARDLRSVLFNWGWHLGMLRGEAEIDLIASLEYQGKGTMQVDGQPCTLTKYRISTNYQDFGSADSDHMHAAQWADVFQHRSSQWSVLLERRYSRCGAHQGKR